MGSPPFPDPVPPPEVNSTSALAAHLGISRWAVSRALNGRGGVSRATVERVRVARTELGFQPDPLARALRGARSGTVGVALSDLRDPSLLEGCMALREQLARPSGGFETELAIAGPRPAGTEAALRRFASRRVEAVVLLGCALTNPSPALNLLQERGIPIVLIETQTKPLAAGLTVAAVDHVQAMDLLVGHLIGLGHRRFTLLGFGGPEGTDPRVEALKQVCQRRDVSWGEHLRWFDPEEPPPAAPVLAWGGHGRPHHPHAQGIKLVDALLRRRGTAGGAALMAASDPLAFGVLRGLQSAGRKVPGEFSLTGYGNDALGEFCAPALTSVDPQLAPLIARAAEVLLAQLHAPGQVETGAIQVNPLLVRRASTGAAGR